MPQDSTYSVAASDMKGIEVYRLLTSSVAPRPIGFVSTLNDEGVPNLAPYSFFNTFGANPPTLVFAPTLRTRDGSSKDTFENVQENMEAVVNIVTYPIVQQMAICSHEYAPGDNEFARCGLTEAPSERVKPPRVAESPVSMECQVKEIIRTGSEGGAGNLIVCEVVYFHLRPEYLDAQNLPDPKKMEFVARLGSAWYTHVRPDTLFEIGRPEGQGVGFAALPKRLRESKVLTGNQLAQMAAAPKLPESTEIEAYKNSDEGLVMAQLWSEQEEESLHHKIGEYIDAGKIAEAWLLGLSPEAKQEH